MADFRRWIYALAVVALLAGFTLPASAQAPTFQCSTTTSVPPTIRAEGFTELVGDIILNCSGGNPTLANQVVQPVNISVSISTNLTSRLLSGGIWSEALLIIDEPHSPISPVNAARPILNCGNTGAPDNGSSGPNVCAIISTGNPAQTYDGTQSTYGTGTCGGGGGAPVVGSYSCGRPNVFQGRLGTPQSPNQYNSVSWNGVPLDPPGTTTNRTLRITNIRADAHSLGVAAAGNFFLNTVQAQISINGNTSLSLSTSQQQVVAFVAVGLVTNITKTNLSFLQCVAENRSAISISGTPQNITLSGPGSFAISNGTGYTSVSGSSGGQVTGSSPQFSFTEGFASSWKAKNIAHILSAAAGAGTAGNGILGPGSSYWQYVGSLNYPKDLNQNVPGAIYNTESGFEYPGGTGVLLDPTPNPPAGLGTGPITATTLALHNGTLIDNAGIADQGTRLQAQISNIPTGSFVLVPEAIALTNGTTSGGSPIATGIAVLVNTAADGSGSYSPVMASTTTLAQALTTFTPLASTGMAVYEVLFADPFSIETTTMTAVVAYNPNLNLNQPDPTKIAQVFGGFAPFYSTAAAHQPQPLPVPFGVNLPIPRFAPGTVPTNPNFFDVNKCACNLLFPFVSASGGFDTGIAIANTSQDNLGITGLSAANQQFGGVQFWYYGTGNNGGSAPASQCTNVASPGTCPTPPATSSSSAVGQVPAGQVLTYVLSSGGGAIGAGANGLDNRANGFTGYIIAQAQFQYCHAYAFITAIGAGPLSAAVSEGYLGLILDNKSFNCSGSVAGLCRTNQTAENLVH